MIHAGRRGSFSGDDMIFLEDHRDQEENDDELQAQPLLDSVRSLVKKERQLAGLQLEEKERETDLWKNKFLQLQRTTRGLDDVTAAHQEAVPPAGESFWLVERPLDGPNGDWDDLRAASKSTGDSCFRELRKRESINLSGLGIAAKELDGAIVKLKWLRRITSVDLSKNKIDDECASALRNLMNIKHLHRLDLSRNEIGASAGVSVLESLMWCRELQVLRLDGNMAFARAVGMGTRIASCLLAARKAGACRHLWSLTLTVNDFDSAILDVEHAPSRRKSGTSPRWSREVKRKGREGGITGLENNSGRPGRTAPPALPLAVPAHPMNALAVARSFHPRAGTSGGGFGVVLDRERNTRTIDIKGSDSHEGITSLGLPFARLHPRTVNDIATYAIASLTRLDLSFCYIGPAGAQVLALALGGGGRGSRSLLHLRLPHNAIGDAGTTAIACALAKNHCLASLDLASNGIRSAGGTALASLFRGNLIALSRLDVGDNPLGIEASQTLASAAAAAFDRASVAVEILGLDRVAGASAMTKQVARRTAASRKRLESKAERCLKSPLIPEESFGLDRRTSLSVIFVAEEVHVDSALSADRDRFIQAYALKLDSRLTSSPPSDRIARRRNSMGPITLEIRWWWWLAVDGLREGHGKLSTPIDTDFPFHDHISWRVSRVRDEEDIFLVKEGVAEGRELLAADSDRYGYSPVKIVCNGWRIGDVLKISVRPARGALSSSCRDLTIRSLEANAEDSYSLLWTDRGEEDALPNPSATERASVASQMHQPPPQQGTGTNICTGDNTYRLRKVLISPGGRILASWKAIVLDDKSSLRVNAKRHEGSGQISDSACRPPCRYAWAIVRTRGAVGNVDEVGVGDTCSVATVSPSSAHVISQDHVSSLPTYNHSHSDSSLCWRWQRFEVDSTGWLPGDSLSLWIRIFPPDHRHHRRATAATAACGVGERSTRSARAEDTSESCHNRYAPSGPSVGGMATSNREGRLEEEGAWDPTLTSQRTRCCRPCVRDFELRHMDDAREDAIAGRTCSRSRTRRSLPLRYARTKASGGAAQREQSEEKPNLPVGTGDRDGLKENSEDPGRWPFPPTSSLTSAHREAGPGPEGGLWFMNATTTGCSWA